MTRLIFLLISRGLQLLSWLMPRTAGRVAYRLFCKPMSRRSVPESVEAIMGRAERITLELPPGAEPGGIPPMNPGPLKVAAYRWPAPAGSGPRVLLVHGWESRAARLAVWVEPLLAAGFEVVAFDGPAHGESAGSRSNPIEFVSAMRALVARVGQPDAVVAHSMGGLATLIATSGHQVFGGFQLRPQKILILAGGNSGVQAMSLFCAALGLRQGFVSRLLDAAAEVSGGHQIGDFDGDRLFPEVEISTLWLHDPEDPVVPFEAAQKVAAACPHVELVALSGLGHHQIARDPAVIERGVAFLSLENPVSGD
ncbi:MAG: alpha/beta hydrolase [Acidobacteriota bacterium]